ncbi:MAG: Crp/Fnr family transcriptional regulator [Cytophagia bacterium]|nr:MAG: Crp/Fnr family transcriptional regulator [Runella sp.]TAG19790.1 MAG: Crp/Fnr family transcriptional regulator [Cytophagales bacterium]TAG39415.1 MAG: Crp/Fnr family transcriptional regulator [Cytophagia bacterium]TAG50818.1 MAG: Crp/Fnr family transcriptional regulator [Runella slithyformis]TAG80602.1 MAG: Crp/Fnr family transcriptional regulator [Cytophagales bacterium]
MSFDSLYRFLGIKADEVPTVGLFSLHHFFLGFGTMLIYVSANVILLENHPETSLPFAYMASAAGMMLVGKIYAYFEHHLRMRQLVIRVLWAVIVLTATILVLVLFGNSVASAVAIMVGFRAIYLLTNLEFWGLSAVVFDVRQSKRLFGVISAGDMPAKALGGMLAVLVHHHSELIFLLLLAFLFFLAAMYTAILTFRTQSLQPDHITTRLPNKATPRLIAQLFGGSELIFSMCLSMTAIAVMATGVEYAFFINVKYKLHSQAEVITYLGGVLTLTYLLATFVKLVVSRQTIERFGLNRVLSVLPLGGLATVLALGVVFFFEFDSSVQLIAYCLVYLGFEVVRRAIFDPVFLVLFQPLSTQQRLRGHTLVKGFYEPLGLGIGGLMLYASHHFWEGGQWFLVEEIAIGALVALWFLNRTYRQYVHTLQSALSRRFVVVEDLAVPQEAVGAILKNLGSDKPREIINAVEWLVNNKTTGLVSSPKLHQSMLDLLTHPNDRVRLSAIEAIRKIKIPLKATQLRNMIRDEQYPPIREKAAWLLSQQTETTGGELLYNSDLMIRKGAIQGLLDTQVAHKSALTALEAMSQNPHPSSQLAALDIVAARQLTQYSNFIKTAFQHDNEQVVTSAIKTAGIWAQPELTDLLINLLPHKKYGRAAVESLAQGGNEVVEALRNKLQTKPSEVLQRRVVAVCGQMQSAEAYELLTELLPKSDVLLRTVTLQAFRNFPPTFKKKAVFEALLQDELQLAQRLLHAQAEPLDKDFKNSLQYEQEATIQRIFAVLMQLYDQDTIASTQISVLHSSRERRANSLELLENIVPRQVYGSLHALLDNVAEIEKIRLMDAQMGVFVANQTTQHYVLHHGTKYFTDWTIRMALRGLPPEILFQYPDLKLMNLANTTVSITERVMVLKNTSLFAETPENVLSSIAPIMREVSFEEGQTIFKKGDLGTSMFVIYDGEVGIYDGQMQLATFGRGDVFGELALLDAEPRSASVLAMSDLQVFRIDQADFYDLMDERGEVMRNIIKMLCQRIRRQNDKLAK